MLIYTCKEHKGQRKIPVPNETGKFQEKCINFSPKQGKYNTILDNLSIGRYFP